MPSLVGNTARSFLGVFFVNEAIAGFLKLSESRKYRKILIKLKTDFNKTVFLSWQLGSLW